MNNPSSLWRSHKKVADHLERNYTMSRESLALTMFGAVMGRLKSYSFNKIEASQIITDLIHPIPTWKASKNLEVVKRLCLMLIVRGLI